MNVQATFPEIAHFQHRDQSHFLFDRVRFFFDNGLALVAAKDIMEDREVWECSVGQVHQTGDNSSLVHIKMDDTFLREAVEWLSPAEVVALANKVAALKKEEVVIINDAF